MSGPTLVDRVRTRLATSGAGTDPAAVAAAVRAEAGGVASDLDVLAALRTLRQELAGTGPLEELLRDPRTTDVLVSGPDAVWVDRGSGLERTPLRFPDDAAVRRLAQRLALAAGRRLDDASPCVDGWLAEPGVRLHAILSPVAVDGTCLSLRVLRPASHDLAALCALGTVDATGEAILRAILAARLAFLVSGGTGSGKTTLLGALLAAVDARERLIVVEDAEELRPRHPHVVRLVARPANIEGAGGVTVRELVRQALRMRPDRLVVGEVRGAEVCDLLAALNTGHDGGAGTVHANSAGEVPARMEALAATGGMSRAALAGQLAAAIQVVLHMRRLRSGERVLDAVAVLAPGPDGVTVRPAWSRGTGPTGDAGLLTTLLEARGTPLSWPPPAAPGVITTTAAAPRTARAAATPPMAAGPGAATAPVPALPGTVPGAAAAGAVARGPAAVPGAAVPGAAVQAAVPGAAVPGPVARVPGSDSGRSGTGTGIGTGSEGRTHAGGSGRDAGDLAVSVSGNVAWALLGAALLALPGAPGSSRLRGLWPRARTGRRLGWAAGPAVAAGAAGLVAAGPGGAVAALLVAVVVRRRRAAARVGRVTGATADELAGALRRITDELRAGGHPVVALAGCEADGPLAARLLAPAAAAAGLGESVAAALRSAGDATGDTAGAARADLDRIATAWSLAERHGVPLADLIADAHDAIRWRRRFGAEVAAQLAGPRATATVLSALPALGLALGQLVGADPLGVLRGGLLGQALLVTGVGLAVAGVAWSDRILAGAVPR